VELVSVNMVRSDLKDVPQHALPAGYSVRTYQPGDEAVWTRIFRDADRYNEIQAGLFEDQFGSDPDLLRRRQIYLCDPSGQEVGTTTAWFDDDYGGLPYGRIHWVAIVPACQGRGLAKPLMTAACNLMVLLGHERAYLVTQTVRLPAIILYLKFGFRPHVRSEADAAAWRGVKEEIGKGPRSEVAGCLEGI